MSNAWQQANNQIEAGRFWEAFQTLTALQRQGNAIFGLDKKLAEVQQRITKAESYATKAAAAEQAEHNRLALRYYEKVCGLVHDYPNASVKVTQLKQTLQQAREYREKASADYDKGLLKIAYQSASKSYELDPESGTCKALLSSINDEIKDKKRSTYLIGALVVISALLISLTTVYLVSEADPEQHSEDTYSANSDEPVVDNPDDPGLYPKSGGEGDSEERGDLNSDTPADSEPTEEGDGDQQQNDQPPPPVSEESQPVNDPDTADNPDNELGQLTQPETGKEWSDIVKGAMPSIVSLRAYNEKDQLIGTSTGFAVGKNILATCWHCIPATAKYMKAATQSGRSIRVDAILAQDKKNDLVLLRYSGSSLTPLALASAKTDQASPVIVVGCPRAYDFSVTDGIVSSWRLNEQQGGRSEVQYTAPTSPGNSGGPVLDKTGNVIGVVSWIRVDAGSQNLNFAISYEHLRELLLNSDANDEIQFASEEFSNSFADQLIDDDAVDAFFDSIVEDYLVQKDYLRLLEINKIDQQRRDLSKRANGNIEVRRQIRELGDRRDALFQRHAGDEPVLVPTSSDSSRVGRLVAEVVSSDYRFVLKSRLTETDSLIAMTNVRGEVTRFLVHGIPNDQVIVGEYVEFSGLYISAGVETFQYDNGRTLRLRGFYAIDTIELREAEDRLEPFDHNMIRRQAENMLR